MSEVESAVNGVIEGLPAEIEEAQEDDHLQLLETLSQPGFIDKFEKGVNNYKRFQSLCLKLTNEAHWINQGTDAKPSYYLQAPGAEAMMIPLGISYEAPREKFIKKQDAEGEYFIIYFEGEATSSMLRATRFIIGAATSRDKFFTKNESFDPERDEANIRKKALSNWEVNCVGRLAGIRSPSRGMLEQAGLNMGLIDRIDYSGNSSEEKGGQTISEPQAKRLYAKCKNLDKARVKAYLQFRGYSSSTEILRKDYDSICDWADKGGPDWEQKPQGTKPSTDPSPTQQQAKDLKEKHQQASPPPQEAQRISESQLKQLLEAAQNVEIAEAGLADFLKTEYQCLPSSVRVEDFDRVLFAITSGEVKGWLELGPEPGAEG